MGLFSPQIDVFFHLANFFTRIFSSGYFKVKRNTPTVSVSLIEPDIAGSKEEGKKMSKGRSILPGSAVISISVEEG